MSLDLQTDQTQEADTTNVESISIGQPWFSIIMIACYSTVFVAQVMNGFDASIFAAGEDKVAVLNQGEFWRVLTGAALHGSIIHYAFNSYAFYSFGRDFEVLSSRFHLPIVFLASAISGAILSLILNPTGISVGASGGIVGIVGYLVVYSFKRREFISAAFRRGLLINIGIVLFYGFVLANSVDNFAHIGGLVAGAIYALIQVPRDSYVDPRDSSGPIKTTGLVCMGAYAATCIFAILLIFRVI